MLKNRRARMEDGLWFKSGIWRKKPDAYIDLAPTGGFRYEVLPFTHKPCRILSIYVQCSNTAVPQLDLWVMQDSQEIEISRVGAVDNFPYFAYISPNVSDDAQSLVNALTMAAIGGMNWLLEGHNIQVRASVGGGTVSNLKCRVKYELMED